MEKIETEKFNLLKELADLQTNISLGKAELLKLKETTEEYMVVREKQAEERVIKVIKESSKALEEATNNHKELASYNSELQAYAEELKQIASSITSLFNDFNTRMHKAENDIEIHYKEVNDILKHTKAERINIQEDRKMLERERQDTHQQMRLLKDRREALDRAWNELKNKNKK